MLATFFFTLASLASNRPSPAAEMPRTVAVPRSVCNSSHVIFNSSRELPFPLAVALRHSLGIRDVADVDEAWDATDVVGFRRLPQRRFIRAGYDPGEAFLAYDNGGRGRHAHLLVFSSGVDGRLRQAANYVGVPAGTFRGTCDDIHAASWRIATAKDK